jgi:hypothetical protein
MYKLEKPHTNKQRADFICQYKGLAPYENEEALFLLESNEKVNAEGEIIINPDYEEEQIQKREEAFYKEFIEIENFGCLRKKPRGYASIIEAFNTMFNLVNVVGSLPRDLITIYTKPDFTNAGQCTENWLIQNSFMNTSLSTAEFSTLYSRLLEIYNLQEHLT